jgi:alpha-L-fucosidase
MSRWFRFVLVLALVLTMVPGGARSARAANPSPDAQWFPDAGYGLFVHWGLSSVKGINISWSMRPGSVLSKTRISSATERDRIVREKDYNLTGVVPLSPNAYWAQANTFNPQSYDPDKWLKAAKDAGFT